MTKADTSTELRTAVRFPLRLPIAITSLGEEHQAETQDISAGGVLFYLESEMTVGSNIEFTISLPAAVLGASTDVLVTGLGRVVRCSVEGERRAVAAVIDEYRFERRQ
ncbi:MAG: PilZ domain-containing protein [Acidobacteriia bacterium]|nr:PilZ domain-containing protein [Terriglobia bacterium]